MSSRRPVFLMGILLVLLLGWMYRASFQPQFSGVPGRPAEPAPLPGKNTVSGLEVKQDKGGAWRVDFDYFYTGEPRLAALRLELLPHPGISPGPRALQQWGTFVPFPQRGAHHVSVAINYPGREGYTQQAAVTMRRSTLGDEVIASQQIDQHGLR
jgi:hypothetical protein